MWGRAPAPSRLHCSVAVGLVDERLGPNGWWCTPPVGRMLYPEVRSALWTLMDFHAAIGTRGGMAGNGITDLPFFRVDAGVIDFQRLPGRAGSQPHDT